MSFHKMRAMQLIRTIWHLNRHTTLQMKCVRKWIIMLIRHGV
ncbi:Urease accessory protein UreE C-terminal domain-containing protein [Dioscorea alata]|uniref:Urease accessory protein UreE C-terminal domain-containing protein n=1 Tax=Dioscorea alata TaxID=55571 RepID=A0ACB7VGN1_DIOAL|nr:Urease accessory protein UreE C-terminal domain-containing protein [Dioscorea alata]